MSCKDCLHYEVCVIVEHSTSKDEDYLTEFGCEDFKDRTKWAEQKRGQWKYYHKQNKAVCTNCSFERDLDENFGRAISCPNCGAKMDK